MGNGFDGPVSAHHIDQRRARLTQFGSIVTHCLLGNEDSASMECGSPLTPREGFVPPNQDRGHCQGSLRMLHYLVPGGYAKDLGG